MTKLKPKTRKPNHDPKDSEAVMSIGDISEVIGISPGVVYYHLETALKKLRKSDVLREWVK